MNDVNAKHVAELRRAAGRAPNADLLRALRAAIEAIEEHDATREALDDAQSTCGRLISAAHDTEERHARQLEDGTAEREALRLERDLYRAYSEAVCGEHAATCCYEWCDDCKAQRAAGEALDAYHVAKIEGGA